MSSWTRSTSLPLVQNSWLQHFLKEHHCCRESPRWLRTGTTLVPEGDTSKGVKAASPQTKTLAEKYTIYPPSKTCPSLDFYHWLLKEMWNLLQGLRCIVRTLASMPKPAVELHWCWQLPGCQSLLCEGCFLKKHWSLDRGYVLLQLYTTWKQDMAKAFLGSKEYLAHWSSGKL